MLSVQPYSNNLTNNQNNNISFQAHRLRMTPPLRETFREISKDKGMTFVEKFMARVSAIVEKLAEPTFYVADNDADIEAFRKMRQYPLSAKLQDFFMWRVTKYCEFLEKRAKKTADKAKNIQ